MTKENIELKNRDKSQEILKVRASNNEVISELEKLTDSNRILQEKIKTIKENNKN